MKVSLNLLREFVELPEYPEQIQNVLTNLGLEVEEIYYPAKKYQNFIIAKVLECTQILDSKNFLCKLTDGKATLDVVCGAPNVATGQNVVLALPGAILPKNDLKVETREINGIYSQGVICSEEELGLGNDSSGIWVLEDKAPLGFSFADYFGLNDVVLDVSITPNRSDCLSHLGIARELSAYFKRDLKLPRIEYEIDPIFKIDDFIEVEILNSEKCPRYTAKVILDVDVIPSPNWLKSRLIVLGMRPINVVVDATNYVMLELGQPLHAFDLDKLEGKKIVVRTAVNGEKFITLDGKERELNDSMLMICDANKSIAIAGVMGGENSEISTSTKNILIESAYFLPSSIRRTSKMLGLMSESSYRFERGVDIENVLRSNERATQLISLLAKGKVANGVVDNYPRKIPQKTISLRFDRAKKIIGFDLHEQRMVKILESLGFEPKEKTNLDITFSVPSYRVDIQGEIDLIEEVARFYGFDNIPEDVSYSLIKSGQNTKESLAVPPLRKTFREYFVSNGFTEFLTPNLFNPKIAKIFDDESKFIELANPLGEELSIMRTSLILSILQAIEWNFRIGRKDLRVFEIGKEFSLTNQKTKFINRILEREVLVFALSGLASPLQWGIQRREVDFYDLKGMVEHFLRNFGIKNYVFQNFNSSIFAPEAQEIRFNNRSIGHFGLVSEKIMQTFELENPVYVAKIFIEELYSYKELFPKFSKVSPYPIVRRDLAFVVESDFSARDIELAIKESAGKFLKEIIVFDVYRGRNIGENRKSIAFALFFSSMERTLTDEEVDEAIDNVIRNIQIKFSAELRTF
ncbi:MAG: phenylalanine--tRNA ligase subunit beta [Candidatus Kapaibacteriales bacterium]